MGKIKITEGQLQKLMERRHSYTDNSPEGDEDEFNMGTPEDAIMNTEEEELSLEDQTIETLKKAHDFIKSQTEEGEENELCVEIMELIEKLEPSDEEEDEEETDDQDVESSDEEEDEMMNESIKSIKANFRRFL
jgi:hypothetical protein